MPAADLAHSAVIDFKMHLYQLQPTNSIQSVSTLGSGFSNSDMI